MKKRYYIIIPIAIWIIIYLTMWINALFFDDRVFDVSNDIKIKHNFIKP